MNIDTAFQIGDSVYYSDYCSDSNSEEVSGKHKIKAIIMVASGSNKATVEYVLSDKSRIPEHKISNTLLGCIEIRDNTRKHLSRLFDAIR